MAEEKTPIVVVEAAPAEEAPCESTQGRFGRCTLALGHKGMHENGDYRWPNATDLFAGAEKAGEAFMAHARAAQERAKK